jgi:O-antigen ligase
VTQDSLRISAKASTGPTLRPRLPWFCIAGLASAAFGGLVYNLSLAGQTGSAWWTLLLVAAIAMVLPAELAAQASGREPFPSSPAVFQPRLPVVERRTPLLLVAFLIWAIVDSAFHGLTKAGLQNLSAYFVLIGGMALVSTSASRGTEQRTLHLLTWVGWFLAVLYGLELALFGFGANSPLIGRGFAITALIVMAGAIAAPHIGVWPRWLPYVLAAEIVLSGSRTAMLSAAVLLAFLVLRGRPTGRLIRGGAVFVVFLVAGWLLVNNVSALHQRFFGGDQGHLFGISINTEGRQQIWPVLIRDAWTHPWTGGGAGTAKAVLATRFPGDVDSHNDYLRMWVDFGFVGAGLWVFGLLTLFQRVWRRCRAYQDGDGSIHYAALLALLAVNIIALTDNVLIYEFALAPLAVIIGLSLAHPDKHARASGL